MAAAALLRLPLAHRGGVIPFRWASGAGRAAVGSTVRAGTAASCAALRHVTVRRFTDAGLRSPTPLTGAVDVDAFLSPSFAKKPADHEYLLSGDAFAGGDTMEQRLCAMSHLPRSFIHRQRLALVYRVMPLLQQSTTARGHETSPLASLNVTLRDLWHVHVPLAMYLCEMHHQRRESARACGQLSSALVVGVNAPPGCGKSTLVQILRFVYEVMRPERERCGRQVLAISQDDFYRTKADREARGIATRMARDGIDPQCAQLLHTLKFAHETPPLKPVQVPVFSKAKDDRVGYRSVTDCVELVLFEGWRVMVDNPELQPFNQHVDISVALTASLNHCRRWKMEQAARDAAAAGLPFDAQKWSDVWGKTILPLARDAAPRVGSSADVVVRKSGDHSVRVLSRSSKAHPCHGYIRVRPGGRNSKRKPGRKG